MSQNVLDKHMSGERGSLVEDFAGYAMLTVALGLAHCAMKAPWDIAYSKCYEVVRYGWKFIALE